MDVQELKSESTTMITHEKQLFSAFARLSDKKAMKHFLQPLPSDIGAQIHAHHGRGRTSDYQDASRTVRFVCGDGRVIACFTVTNVSETEAALIAGEWQGAATWTLDAFMAAVKRALGEGVVRVN
ncbi:MAG: hypothetical protein KF779_09125 [Hyphomonadaceae bacterium]|nr:hypothetical protein [Hyphomonadaceae bacterium]